MKENKPTKEEQLEAIEIILEYINHRVQKLKQSKQDKVFQGQYSENELIKHAKAYMQSFLADFKKSREADEQKT